MSTIKRLFAVLVIFVLIVSSSSVMAKETSLKSKTPVIIIPGIAECWEKDFYGGILDYYETLNEKDLYTDYRKKQFKLVYDQFNKGRSTICSSILNVLSKDTAKSTNIFDVLKDNPYITYFDGVYYYIDPISGKYNALQEMLVKEGYQKEKDMFIFGYDTLMVGVSDNAAKLKKYVDFVLKKTNASKVRIIANDEGNLVARKYIQDLEGYKTVEKFMMVAPPNKGAVSYYGLVKYGATQRIISNEAILLDFVNDALLEFLTYRSTGGQDNADRKKEWIDKNAPAIKDMMALPVIENDSKYIDISNYFLLALNSYASVNNLKKLGRNNIQINYGSNLLTVYRYDKYYFEKSVECLATLWDGGDTVVLEYSADFDPWFIGISFKGVEHSNLISKNKDSLNSIVQFIVSDVYP